MQPVLVVVGPTGVGKSDLGVDLARAIGGEVLNADSMQLYAGMDIGTAKLTPAERGGIRHHLLDIWPVTRRASVAEYQRLGRDLLADLDSRGVPPVVVGGSGLYVRALLDQFEFPGTEPDLRAGLEAELAVVGPQALHARLAALDAAAAGRISQFNGRRLVRALEVHALTGGVRPDLPAYTSPYRLTLVGLDRTDLADRVERRVARMFDAGLVQEVARLAVDGLRDGVTARRALGYGQVLRVLDGELKEDQARADTVAATRRYARRQRSWFRRDPRIRWFDPARDDVAGQVLRSWERRDGRGERPGP